MDLDELRAFMAVVETGSFSAAAKSLNFARTTLNRQVDELEARSGVQLLKRATDSVTATKAGETLARKGREILAETRELFQAVRALESQDDLITLEVPVGQPPEMERAAHATFQKAAPNLRWRVRYSDGKFDPESDALVVIHYGAAPEASNEDWHHVRAARIRVQLVASSKYLESAGAPESVEELKEHPILMWERHDRDPSKLPRLDGEPSVEIEPIVLTPAPYSVRYFAAGHNGIALAPNARLSNLLIEDEELKAVLPEVIGDTVEVWISTRRDNEAGPFGVLIQAIIKFTGAALGGWE